MSRTKLIICLLVNLFLAWARAAQALELTSSYLFGLETIPVAEGTPGSLFYTFRNGGAPIRSARARLLDSNFGHSDGAWVDLGSFEAGEEKLQPIPFTFQAHAQPFVTYTNLTVEIEADGRTELVTKATVSAGHTSEFYTDTSLNLFSNPIRVSNKILVEWQSRSDQKEFRLFDDDTWELQVLPIVVRGIQPDTSFDGENIVFLNDEDEYGMRKSLRLYRLSNGETRTIDSNARHPHLQDGKVLFFRGGNLFIHQISTNQTQRVASSPLYEIADAPARLFSNKVYYVARLSDSPVIVEHDLATGNESIVLRPFGQDFEVVAVSASHLIFREGSSRVVSFNRSTLAQVQFHIGSEPYRQLAAQTSERYSVYQGEGTLILYDIQENFLHTVSQVPVDSFAMNGMTLIWIEPGQYGRDYAVFPIREVNLNYP